MTYRWLWHLSGNVVWHAWHRFCVNRIAAHSIVICSLRFCSHTDDYRGVERFVYRIERWNFSLEMLVHVRYQCNCLPDYDIFLFQCPAWPEQDETRRKKSSRAWNSLNCNNIQIEFWIRDDDSTSTVQGKTIEKWEWYWNRCTDKTLALTIVINIIPGHFMLELQSNLFKYVLQCKAVQLEIGYITKSIQNFSCLFNACLVSWVSSHPQSSPENEKENKNKEHNFITRVSHIR